MTHRFQYHPPTNEAARTAHESIRSLMRTVNADVLALLPADRPREAALFTTKIEEAMMWANAAVARSQGSEGGQ